MSPIGKAGAAHDSEGDECDIFNTEEWNPKSRNDDPIYQTQKQKLKRKLSLSNQKYIDKKDLEMDKINATKAIYEDEKMRIIKNLLVKKREIDIKKSES